jgi:hypothetical protein
MTHLRSIQMVVLVFLVPQPALRMELKRVLEMLLQSICSIMAGAHRDVSRNELSANHRATLWCCPRHADRKRRIQPHALLKYSMQVRQSSSLVDRYILQIRESLSNLSCQLVKT